MTYIVDPTNVNSPANTDGAKQGGEEFRALKGYISTLVGGGGFPGVNVFRRNVIIGGDFDTNPWQRGTPFTGIASLSFSADRWRYVKSSTVVEDIAKIQDAPVIGTAYKNRVKEEKSIYCLETNVTTADAVIGISDYARLQHAVEGYNYRFIHGLTSVIGFWHKHTKIGIYCVALTNFNGTRTYVDEYTQAVSDVWEFDYITITPDITASWDFSVIIGALVIFTKAAGTNYHTTKRVWTASSGVFATVNQVNSLDTIGNKFRILLVQLEPGSLPSRFEQRLVAEELVLCQRYYEKTFRFDIAPAQNVGLGTGELAFRTISAAANFNTRCWKYEVEKRTTPTIITYNPAAANANWRDTTGGVDKTVTQELVSFHDCLFGMSDAPTAGNLHRIHATADAEL